MTTIIISDDFDNDRYDVSQYVDWESCGIYDILNTEEIKLCIAHKFTNQDTVNKADIYNAIVEYFNPLIDEVFSETIDTLMLANGIKVYDENTHIIEFVGDE